MNRLIKFRAWHLTLKQMFSPEEMGADQLTLMPDGTGFINVSGTDTSLSQKVPQMIPMQFTGLKDKNGKEIYEGDILKVDRHSISKYRYWSDQTSVVSFEGSCFVHRSANGFFNTVNENASHSSVIGNIYETPELINQTKK